MVVFAVDISRRVMKLRGTGLQCGRRIQLRQRCNPINGMARLPSRQGRFGRSDVERYADLGCGSRIRIKEFTSLQHCVHDPASLRSTATAALLKPIRSRS